MGTFVFLLFGLVLVSTHLARIGRARTDLLHVELPRLAAATEDQLVSYFDLNVRSLRLLADVYEWETMFSQFAEDPAEARRLAESFAASLEVKSVDFVDLERRLVHAYWSPEPIQLDPERERDTWFFDTWAVPDPPETQVTLYYDQDMGGNAVYTDHLLRDADGNPVGVVGILTDVATLANHIQRTLIEDELFYLLSALGTPMVRVEHDSFEEFGPVYDLEGRSEAGPPEAPASSTEQYVSRAMPIPGLGAEGIVYLNTRSRLRDIRLSIFSRMTILLIAYVVLVGSYIALISLHARRLRTQAEAIQEHRTRLDDIISILTHNLSNDLHALRQRFTIAGSRTGVASEGAWGNRSEGEDHGPDRSSDAILMDMEQVLQNAIYSTQLGGTAIRSTAGETSSEELLQRLHDACSPAAMAKGQNLRIINTSVTAIETDEDLVFHLLFNVLGNAIKFSPFGSTIICGAWDTPTFVDISVIDQGPGFLPEDHDQLFQKHQRLSARPTSGERSTGMGLYVARRLADTVGARITLLDEPPSELEFLVEELGHIGAVWLISIPTSARTGS